jgi:hypothetical protein
VLARPTVPVRLTAIGCAIAATSLVAALAPSASASPASAVSSASQSASAPLSRGGGFEPGPAQIVPGGLAIGPLARTTSKNWAGYADRGHTFSVVRSTWKQPKVTCTGTDAIAAFWVGLDGYASGTVEQDGTLAYCHNGKPTYYTWWEMYPHNSVQLMHASVRPGDKVTSTVIRKGTSYTLKVVDHTHPGNSFTRHTVCAVCKDSSAEWIAERVTGQHGLIPLAKFNHVVFAGNKVGVGSARGDIDKYAHDAITMVNNGGSTLASVSQLKKGGKKFVASWHRMQ